MGLELQCAGPIRTLGKSSQHLYQTCTKLTLSLSLSLSHFLRHGLTLYLEMALAWLKIFKMIFNFSSFCFPSAGVRGQAPPSLHQLAFMLICEGLSRVISKPPLWLLSSQLWPFSAHLSSYVTLKQMPHQQVCRLLQLIRNEKM
jgi:hypothetical protein